MLFSMTVMRHGLIGQTLQFNSGQHNVALAYMSNLKQESNIHTFSGFFFKFLHSLLHAQMHSLHSHTLKVFAF